MKVGIISPALRKRGGIERVPVMQAKLLSERGYDVSLITSVYEMNCYPELLDSKIQIRQPRIRTPILEVTVNTLYSAFQSYRWVSDLDLVISHMLVNAYNATHKVGIPCILYLHTLPRHPKRSVAEAVDQRFRRAIMLPSHLLYSIVNPVVFRWSDAALLESDKVLVNSKNTGQQLEDYCGRKDYVVCYPAVDMEHLAHRSHEIEDALRNRFGLGDNVVLSVSRHQPKKCLHWLPEILYHVSQDVPDAQIVITGGETPHTGLIRAAMKQWRVEERVILTGEVTEEELGALYHIAKVLCFPSVLEDFGLPIVEAMYCGCPPVAWDDFAGPSEIIESGVNGLLVKPYELQAMAQGLLFFLKDNQNRDLIARNATTKSRLFSWKTHMCILEKSIREVEEKHDRRR